MIPRLMAGQLGCKRKGLWGEGSLRLRTTYLPVNSRCGIFFFVALPTRSSSYGKYNVQQTMHYARRATTDKIDALAPAFLQFPVQRLRDLAKNSSADLSLPFIFRCKAVFYSRIHHDTLLFTTTKTHLSLPSGSSLSSQREQLHTKEKEKSLIRSPDSVLMLACYADAQYG